MKHALQNYCGSHSITHQTLCAHTPQQNGVAEQKNYHLHDIT